jgi:hypothetical protein
MLVRLEELSERGLNQIQRFLLIPYRRQKAKGDAFLRTMLIFGPCEICLVNVSNKIENWDESILEEPLRLSVLFSDKVDDVGTELFAISHEDSTPVREWTQITGQLSISRVAPT